MTYFGILIGVTLSIFSAIIPVYCDQSWVCRLTTETEPDPNGYTIQGNMEQFVTPDFPNITISGLSCWWRATNDVQPVQLTCFFSVPESSENCSCNTPDRIEVTTYDGRVFYYCGEGTLSVYSASRLEYKTSPRNQGGKINCYVNQAGLTYQ